MTEAKAGHFPQWHADSGKLDFFVSSLTEIGDHKFPICWRLKWGVQGDTPACTLWEFLDSKAGRSL